MVLYRSPSYEQRRDVSPPESSARSPSEERHQNRRGRHEVGRSGSESKRYGDKRSRSGSPLSPDGRHAQKGSNKHESYSDAQRLEHDRSHSPRHVQPESPPRSSRKGRRRSPSHSGGSSPERCALFMYILAHCYSDAALVNYGLWLFLRRHSRSPSRSPPPRRGHSSRHSDSRSRSPPENQYARFFDASCFYIFADTVCDHILFFWGSEVNMVHLKTEGRHLSTLQWTIKAVVGTIGAPFKPENVHAGVEAIAAF